MGRSPGSQKYNARPKRATTAPNEALKTLKKMGVVLDNT